MRISSSLIFQTGLRTINTQQSDLLQIYQQIASGQKMVTPADDPLAASQAINISQSQALNARYGDNRAVANRNLGTEEDALASLTLQLQDVHTRLVEAGNGTLSDADRATLASVLDNARAAILGIANTTDGSGQYVFSGSQGNTPAFSSDGFTYQGDAMQRLVQADQTRRLAISDVGTDVFARMQPGTLDYTSQQSAQGAGSTAVVGQPTLVDRSAAADNGDARHQFKVAFVDDGGTLSYTVQTLDGSDPSAVWVPDDASVVPQPWTGDSSTLELGHGVTVQLAGTPAVGDAFDVTPLAQLDSSQANLFTTLDALVAQLGQPTQASGSADAALRNTLNTAMQRLASNYDNVLTVRSSIGARMNELDALNDTGVQRDMGYTQALSGLQDLDYYEATMRLNLRKMALEGAGLAFQTIQNLSLFNLNK